MVDPFIPAVGVALLVGLAGISITWAVMDLYNVTKMRVMNHNLNTMTNRRKDSE